MTPFFKLSGAGNDFIALVEPSAQPTLEQIRAWCRRGLSLGADAVLVLSRHRGGVRLGYFNADGSPAALCLNGTRCAALLALELGWARGEVTVETGAGPIRARQAPGGEISLEVEPPRGEPEPHTVEAAERCFEGWSLSTGDPHFVVAWEASLTELPVLEWGRALRRHEAFAPAGTNVQFVRFLRPDALELRTYERGVEGETLACGSGVLAAVAVGRVLGRAALPLQALTAGGGVFSLQALPGSNPERWLLGGEARLVARGELLDDASRIPEPPAWSPGEAG